MGRKARIFVMMTALIVALGLLAGPAHSQGDWTCDNGPNDVLNAAQAAFDAGDLDLAYDLATQAQDICVANLARYGQVITLLMRIEAARNPQPTRPPEPELPLSEPGPYGVGRLVMTFVDESRDGRELETILWYPAVAGSSSYLVPEYEAEPDTSGAPYPLIIYSHFLWGEAGNTLGSANHLASYGFVVASTSHQDPESAGRELIDRPLDVLFVLDQLAAITDGSLVGIIDTDNVGVTGYSSGGDTALWVNGTQVDPEYYLEWCGTTEGRTLGTCQFADAWDDLAAYRAQFDPLEEGGLWPATTDERIRAVVPIAACEGMLYGERGLAAANVPTLIIANTEDQFCLYERDAVFIYDHLGSEDRYLISLIGVDHIMPIEGGREIRGFLNHFTTAFFGYYLQGHEEYAEYFTEEYVESFEMLGWGPVEVEGE